MKISNQKPAELSPVYSQSVGKAFDLEPIMRETLVKPLFTPLVASASVTMQSNGQNITEDMIAMYASECCDEQFIAASQAAFKEILSNSLINFNKDTNLSMRELFAIQSAAKEGLDEPDENTIYSPAIDVIPTAKKFLAGQDSYDKWFATMAFYTRCEALAVYFSCESAFEDFKKWFGTIHSQTASLFSNDVNQLCSQFMALKLDRLTESLKLRGDSTENNEPYSFARYLVNCLMEYTKQVSQSEFGIMPFDLRELFVPCNLIFVNVERHSKASAKEISDEWDIIKKSSKMPIKMISNKSLNKLTAQIRNLNRIKSTAAAAAASRSKPDDASRAARLRFRKTAPTMVDITTLIKRIMSKMALVAKSENSYKSVKLSYQRPNRRDPDDFNKMGKMVSTKYFPDIHLYIDTSGSISERNYQDTIKACIIMAKKLNINLYFNSFSHVMSQTTKLATKDKSIAEIYKTFQKVPKVDGGTDYEQIWEFIEASPRRRRELSIIITDFEYTAPNRFVKHPKNLYYIPCSNMDYDIIKSEAKSFCRSMYHNDSGIRKHLLF